ncbi:MAG: helix-turn-helix domain-containing protein [Terriglobales bacterium]
MEELLQEQAVENIRLEFKRDVPPKDETLKKVSSFANTFGGLVVVGASARSTDGRIEGLPGVDVQDGYKQKVVDWCFGGASPPLVVGVSDPIPTPDGSGRVCYVISVPESDVAPHFLNGRNGVWIRTDEFSGRFDAQLANESELRSLLDRRKLILERRAGLLKRARQRFDVYAAKGHTAASGLRTKFGLRIELCVVPRFPARPLCEQGQLQPLITANHYKWRGILFPLPGGSVVSQHESAIVLGAAGPDSMFEVNIWGMLFYCAKIADAENPTKTWGIHLYGFVGHILLFLRHSDQMLRALGYAGPICIEVRLSSIRGAPWLHGHAGGPFSMSGSELDDEVEFSISTTSDSLRQDPDVIAKNLFRYVFFSVNWPALIATPQALADLIGMGYRYNSWSRPAAPRT